MFVSKGARAVGMGKKVVKNLDFFITALQLLPSQAKPSQAKPSQAKPSQAKPSQAKPSYRLVSAAEFFVKNRWLRGSRDRRFFFASSFCA